MWQVFQECLLFLHQEKKWWLIPLIAILLLMAAVIMFASGSVLAPLERDPSGHGTIMFVYAASPQLVACPTAWHRRRCRALITVLGL